MDLVQPNGTSRPSRKRKAENQDNERLSKRLSLLNLERNGEKLYVPVESPNSSPRSKSTTQAPKPAQIQEDDDVMHLDNTKHKVYIYDLDAELSDSDNSSDDGRLVFLPDIQRHLRETRIPPSVLANSEGELAGMNKQLVLYNIPSSLTIPEGQDSVRKAIIETRARVRAKHANKKLYEDALIGQMNGHPAVPNATGARDWYVEMVNGLKSNGVGAATAVPGDMEVEPNQPSTNGIIEDDPDAMDIG